MSSANRFITLEAAAEIITDGRTLALGGVTLYRRPVAFAHALLRRTPRPRDLTLLCFTAGYESDILIGAGCVRAIRSAYVGLEAFGLAPMFTQAAQPGTLTIIEETEVSIVLGIRAQLGGVGFIPSRAWQGTDLLRLRPDVKTIHDPYQNENLTAFPAIACDVAVIHALAADAEGNVLLNNNLGIDMELIYVADTVIVTVERMVAQLKPTSAGVIMPHPSADYIVVATNGAQPTSCYPDYAVDGHWLMRYVEACNAGDFAAYLQSVL